jgi:hypothetical protein
VQQEGRTTHRKPKSWSRLLSSGEARPPSALASKAAPMRSLQRRLHSRRCRGEAMCCQGIPGLAWQHPAIAAGNTATPTAFRSPTPAPPPYLPTYTHL